MCHQVVQQRQQRARLVKVPRQTLLSREDKQSACMRIFDNGGPHAEEWGFHAAEDKSVEH